MDKLNNGIAKDGVKSSGCFKETEEKGVSRKRTLIFSPVREEKISKFQKGLKGNEGKSRKMAADAALYEAALEKGEAFRPKTFSRKKIKENDRGEMPLVAVILFVFIIVWCATIVGMLIWGFLTSLKSNDNFMKDMWGLPKKWRWDNYATVFGTYLKADIIDRHGIPKTVYFEGMLLNSLIFSTVGPLISLATTWVMAYVTSAFDNKVSKFIYSLNIVLMLVPVVGTLPSSLQLYTKLGLYDTWGFVVFSSIGFVGSTYMIFYAYFSTVSKELKEAAMIDGAGNIGIMLRIVFPLTARMFSVMYLSSFISAWNNYMTMIIWLPSKPSIAYGIYTFSSGVSGATSWPNMQIAGAMILAVPMIALFVIFKDKLIGGVTVGQLK